MAHGLNFEAVCAADGDHRDRLLPSHLDVLVVVLPNDLDPLSMISIEKVIVRWKN